MKDSFTAGARSGFANTGGSSTMGTVGGQEAGGGASAPQTSSSSADGGPPAWAQRMKQNQALSHGAQTAAQALKSGDSHGGGHSVDLSQGE
jgi:type IV secretion system protein TrbL